MRGPLSSHCSLSQGSHAKRLTTNSSEDADVILTNGGQDAGTTAAIGTTTAADSTYTQLNPTSAAAVAAAAHLGCNGVGGGAISRDTSTQVVVLSPASVTEVDAAGGEGSFRLLRSACQVWKFVKHRYKGMPEIDCCEESEHYASFLPP